MADAEISVSFYEARALTGSRCFNATEQSGCDLALQDSLQ